MNPTAPMPSYSDLREDNPEQFEQIVGFVASLKDDMPSEDESEPAEQANAEQK